LKALIFEEDERLASLSSYQVLQTVTDNEFEDIVMLASKICDSPISFIGFIDDKRLWLKARCGLEIEEVTRENSICEYVLQSKESLMVEDLRADSRFAENDFVRGPTGLRFYFGLPIICPSGRVLGTLCVADSRPRKLSEGQITCMRALVRRIVQNLNTTLQNQKLIDSNKSSSLGMFSIYMAHEINNALTIIEGYNSCAITELSKSNLSQNNISKLLGQIQNTSNRIGKIVNGIKIYSRNAKNDPFERVSVNLLLEETMAICKERCKNENIDLKLILPQEDIFIECHSSEIIQVLINLINNSIYAVGPVRNKTIKIEAKLLDTEVEFSVTDSGPGVPENIKNKLMQPFFTTKEMGKGTGLGLYISKSIIEFHSGIFFLDQNPLTRFGFVLPLK
jgi:signal transduction histidine kinase